MKFKWLREVKSMDFKKMLINIRKKVTVALFLLCVKVKKRYTRKMPYEGSFTVCMGRIANQRKIPKWLPFKNYRPESLNI